MELEMKLSQSQTLTPQMELSVRILQMDTVQLNEYLKEIMLENPVIEFDQPQEKDDRHKLALRKLEWLENQTVREKENVGYYDDNDDFTIEKTAGAQDEEQLTDHLLAQVSFCGAAAALIPPARFVIGCIDENGYLTATRQEMAQESRFDPNLLEQAITLVQGFDPLGVCAADLGECLRLQLHPEDTVALRLVEDYLEDIPKNKQMQLAKKLGVSVEDVEHAIKRIRQLNPKPGALYAKRNVPAYITPDVVVTGFEDRYHVMLCEFSYPEIRLNNSYLRMAKESADQEVIDYISGKVSQINWIQKCIESRNKTLLAVARTIVKQQERFFRYGPQYLNVLRMRDVAELIEMHESTVSRAVRDKYLQCAHGVYPLRHFFVKGLENSDGTSTHDVKRLIKEMIDEEDKSDPLSDQRITDLLAARRGLGISRRTVAKYREEMGYAKSVQRMVRVN